MATVTLRYDALRFPLELYEVDGRLTWMTRDGDEVIHVRCATHRTPLGTVVNLPRIERQTWGKEQVWTECARRLALVPVCPKCVEDRAAMMAALLAARDGLSLMRGAE